MRNCALLLSLVGAVVVAGCSSAPDQASPPPGTLVAGTAEITVNDTDLGQFHSVQCAAAGPVTTITTGNDASGSTSVVSNADGLTAVSVSLRDLGGFTGSFNQGLDSDAGPGSEENVTVEMTGNTYSISGKADGFNTDKPSFRTTGTFTIKVAC